MRPVILLLTVWLALFSCEKTETIDLPSIVECHQSKHLDSAAITTKLAGVWSLSWRFCYKSSFTNPLPLEVKINFNDNSNFTVTDYSGILAQGNWKLKNIGTDMWALDLTAPSEYLNGRILFCKNEVVFDSTYVNGEGCCNGFYK